MEKGSQSAWMLSPQGGWSQRGRGCHQPQGSVQGGVPCVS